MFPKLRTMALLALALSSTAPVETWPAKAQDDTQPLPKNTPKGPKQFRKFNAPRTMGRKNRGYVEILILAVVMAITGVVMTAVTNLNRENTEKANAKIEQLEQRVKVLEEQQKLKK